MTDDEMERRIERELQLAKEVADRLMAPILAALDRAKQPAKPEKKGG